MPVIQRAAQAGLRLSTLGLLLASASGCADPFVEGSLGSILDLHYDQVFVDTSADEVGVRFVQQHGAGTAAGEDTVLRVTAWRTGIALFPNIDFDLAELISGSTQRGTVSRSVTDDPRRTFPPIKVGELLLRDVPDPTNSGMRIRGSFHVLFENGTEYASGHTVFANFEGRVP